MKLMQSVQTRFFHNYDFDRVIEIDCNSSGKYSWEPEELYEVMNSKHGNGMIAVDNKEYPVGFCIYNLENLDCFNILHLVVDKTEQRKGIGSTLINKMKAKLNSGRHYLNFDVSEINLKGQLFLKAMGFQSKLVRSLFDDIIRFKYEVK